MNQYVGDGVWTRGSNRMAWKAILGSKAGAEEGVSHLAAVGRATNVRNLTPAYISAGSAEGFRDENVAYAHNFVGGRCTGRVAHLAGGLAYV